MPKTILTGLLRPSPYTRFHVWLCGKNYPRRPANLSEETPHALAALVRYTVNIYKIWRENMEIRDDKYKNHCAFNELTTYIDFYEHLSFNVFPFVSLGTNAIGNIDTYVFSSLKGTLESIRIVLENGRINDAWALLRKYHDSIIINIYSNLYLKNNFSLENFVVEQINGWLNGTSKMPEFRVMSQYIRNCSEFSELTKLFFDFDDRYKNIRERCNNNTHYNFYANVLLNDNEIFLKNRVKMLNIFSLDARNLFILHVGYIFSIRECYMASSDFIDSLDCGMTPPDDSQYWVAPFVQTVFDEIISKYREDISNHIKNSTNMHLT
jgi:hypothetical protein